jgi:large subunit ribosomal protein L21
MSTKSTKAVIATGGKQYLAGVGDVLTVEKLPGAVGDAITFDQVLLVADGEDIKVGTPTVTGAMVRATINAVGRLTKVTGSKFKNKTRYTRTLGHRQHFTQVRIVEIA